MLADEADQENAGQGRDRGEEEQRPQAVVEQLVEPEAEQRSDNRACGVGGAVEAEGSAQLAGHWLNAIEMGQHAAESLLLGREAARPFTPIPRFRSEQHGYRIQSVGRPDLGEHMTLVEGSTESRRFVASFERDGAVVGAIGMDSPRRMIRYAELIDEQWPARPAALSDVA